MFFRIFGNKHYAHCVISGSVVESFGKASGVCTGTPVRIRGVNAGNVVRVNPLLERVLAYLFPCREFFCRHRQIRLSYGTWKAILRNHHHELCHNIFICKFQDL